VRCTSSTIKYSSLTLVQRIGNGSIRYIKFVIILTKRKKKVANFKDLSLLRYIFIRIQLLKTDRKETDIQREAKRYDIVTCRGVRVTKTTGSSSDD
jgi:hypothetical protein